MLLARPSRLAIEDDVGIRRTADRPRAAVDQQFIRSGSGIDVAGLPTFTVSCGVSAAGDNHGARVELAERSWGERPSCDLDRVCAALSAGSDGARRRSR